MTNKSAFLTLSFGSTFTETRLKDIGGIEQALQQPFPIMTITRLLLRPLYGGSLPRKIF